MASTKVSSTGHGQQPTTTSTATTTTTHKRNHSRKKSTGTSTADLFRMTKRPTAALSRRMTAASLQQQKLGRKRDAEWTETTELVEDNDDDLEEESETFPQYCMACEKEFVPVDSTTLYCSNACRVQDETQSYSLSTSPVFATSPSSSLQSLYSDVDEPRDIIPRAVPSRPTSVMYGNSPPGLSRIETTSPAMSALRSIAHHIPSPSSPSSNTTSFITTATSSSSSNSSSSSSIWPWRSGPAIVEPTSAKSYTLKGTTGSAYPYDLYTTMGRPLAPKKPGVSVRPRSIELMQPLHAMRWD